MQSRARPGSFIVYVLMAILAAFLVSMILQFTREDPKAIYKKNSNIRVEVLNGCGVNKLAIHVANLLRKQGFNVLKIGNTSTQDFEETVVIERSDKGMKNASYVAKRIGCNNVGKDIDPALYLEVTLIVGKDYEKIFPNINEDF